MVAAAMALVISEMVLRRMARTRPALAVAWGRQEPPEVDFRIKSSLLMSRPNPDFHEHDRVLGFRNFGHLTRAEIVAMGDSQTYGMGLPPGAAWPQQLEYLSGRTTYNMAWGAFGPIHYLYLFDEALVVKPRWILVGFFAGTDLYDAYFMAYERNKGRFLVEDPEEPLSLLVQLGVLPDREERIRLILERSDKARTVSELPRYDEEPYVPTPLPPPVEPTEYRGQNPLLPAALDYSLRRWIRPYYRLKEGRACRRLVRSHRMPLALVPGEGPAPVTQPYDHRFYYQGLYTVVTPELRSPMLDLTDPMIAEGYRLTVAAFREMKRRTDEEQLEFAVVLIPTKELAFWELVDRVATDIPQAYQELVDREELIRHLLQRARILSEGRNYPHRLPP